LLVQPILFSYQNLPKTDLGSLMQADFSARGYLPKLARISHERLRRASWLKDPDGSNYSCGTVPDLHLAFPVTSDGWSPSEPTWL